MRGLRGKYSGAALHVPITLANNRLVTHLYICTEIFNFNNQIRRATEFRTRPVLESLGIPFNDHTIFMQIILHELGHANQSYLFANHKASQIYNIVHRQNKIFYLYATDELNSEWFDAYGMSVGQYISPLESRADLYSYMHLPAMWKKLKHLVPTD